LEIDGFDLSDVAGELPAPAARQCSLRDRSVSAARPPKADEFSPNPDDQIVRVHLEDSPAFLEGFLVPRIRRKQEDEIVRQFQTVGMTRHEPTELRFLLIQPGSKGWIYPRDLFIPSNHLRHCRPRVAGTTTAAVHGPDMRCREGTGLLHQRKVVV